MSQKSQTQASPAAPASDLRELVITRVFNAPRERVWRAWTDPEHFARWWGPRHFTCPVARLDLRVGGRYHVAMRSPEGQDFWSTGTYREIVAPERLVYTDSFADADGNAVPASHYGFPADFPFEQVVTVTLEALGPSQTRLTLRHAGMPVGEHGELASQGWNESLDKLAAAVE